MTIKSKKNRIGFEEKWQTVCDGKLHGKGCKVGKRGYGRKNNTLVLFVGSSRLI